MKILILILLISEVAYSKITVQGHRGARAVRPENTLNAIKYAMDVGVDILEFDLVASKDKHLVLSHDPILNETICFDPSKKIKPETPFNTLTLKQIKTLDCGSLINPRFPNQIPSPGEKIPTLDEVFNFVKKSKRKDIQFNIETKIVPYSKELTPKPKAFAKLIVNTIKKHKLQDQTVIQSFDYRTLKWIKKLNPKIKTSQLLYGNLFDFSLIAKDINADWVSPNFKWITRPLVKDLHKHKVKVSAWTLNEPSEWEYAIRIGVDSIITDDPEALIKYLKKRKLR